jgi:hypothetical protein
MGTSRKRRIAAGVVGLSGLVLVAAYLGCPDPPGPGIRWANVDRIAEGMSRAEAVAVIGFPPQTEWRGDPVDLGPPATQTSLMWSDVECDIWVFLDSDDRVVGRLGVGRPPPSWFGRIRSRLGI